MVTPLNLLAQEMESLGCSPSSADWSQVRHHATERRVASRRSIYADSKVADRWIFITSGLAGSQYTHSNGSVTLTRFFEPGNIAGNVTSTWTQDFGSDELLAVSDVEGVEFPHDFLFQEYMGGKEFGAFIRLKVIETLRFDKDLLVNRSLNNVEARLRFLEERHKSVLELAMKRDIAAFLGITPQGYSRVLRRRQAD